VLKRPAAAGLDGRAFVVALGTLPEAEKVDLVVARDALALRIVRQARIEHLVGLSAHSGSEPPISQMPCSRALAARKSWIGPCHRMLAHPDLVAHRSCP
jgi:HEAT repeat protein